MKTEVVEQLQNFDLTGEPPLQAITKANRAQGKQDPNTEA